MHYLGLACDHFCEFECILIFKDVDLYNFKLHN